MGAELFHAAGRTDGRTGMTKLIVAFRNFENAPNNDVFVKFFKQYRHSLAAVHKLLESNWRSAICSQHEPRETKNFAACDASSIVENRLNYPLILLISFVVQKISMCVDTLNILIPRLLMQPGIGNLFALELCVPLYRFLGDNCF